MNRINKEWHEKNYMPKNATMEQRVSWHLEHQKNCQCHPTLPLSIIEEIKKRGTDPKPE